MHSIRKVTEQASTFSSQSDAILDIWIAALSRYKEVAGFDLEKERAGDYRGLEECNSPEDALRVIAGLVDAPHITKQTHLALINDAVAELAASLQIPGGKVIFVAFGILLKTVQNMQDRLSAVAELLFKFEQFFCRLDLRRGISYPVCDQEILTRICAEFLHVLALAQKIVHHHTRKGLRGRLQRIRQHAFNFREALLDNSDVKSAMRRLDELTHMELQITAAQTFLVAAETRVHVQNVQTMMGAMLVRYPVDSMQPVTANSFGTIFLLFSDYIQDDREKALFAMSFIFCPAAVSALALRDAPQPADDHSGRPETSFPQFSFRFIHLVVMTRAFPLECTGKKRVLLIGISKSAAEGYPEFDGAHGDVEKIHRLLLEVYHYEPSAITILVDDGIEGHVQPTRRNILAAISELVKDVKAGDKLCFYYAGHSTQRPNERSNSEEDGLDECMISLDGELIVDNELHDTLVRPLPAGSRLVAILDTCNSGSLLDLKHYRCNRVPVPWVWRGKRDSEEIRNSVTAPNTPPALAARPMFTNTTSHRPRKTINEQIASLKQMLSKLRPDKGPHRVRSSITWWEDRPLRSGYKDLKASAKCANDVGRVSGSVRDEVPGTAEESRRERTTRMGEGADGNELKVEELDTTVQWAELPYSRT
ncbi:caspase domain-containing protein [Mycena olivaceomarginata]|nr:caspase domain-containing protein [Mycena olivaceomarginata]